jgi:hypothetical protein
MRPAQSWFQHSLWIAPKIFLAENRLARQVRNRVGDFLPNCLYDIAGESQCDTRQPDERPANKKIWDRKMSASTVTDFSVPDFSVFPLILCRPT